MHLQKHIFDQKYRHDIDGLRAFAVISVVLFHAFPKFIGGGFIGVDIFFVISGFLISTIIFNKIDGGNFSLIDFYVRRIKRIFPALLLILISSYTFGWLSLMADEYKQLGLHIAAGAGFFSNFILWSSVGYFDNAAETKPLLHLWSLGVEEQFYMVWPIIIVFSRKIGVRYLYTIIFFGALSFLLGIYSLDKDASASFYMPWMRFWELLSGGILSWFFYCGIDKKIGVYRHINTIAFLGISILTFGVFYINKDLMFPGWWALVPVSGAFFVLLAGPNAWLNRFILSSRLLVWFGLISFPLYLWHWPLLSFAALIEGGLPDLEIRFLAVTAAVILAWLTYFFLERPIRFGGHEKLKATLLIVIMIFVGFVGFVTYKRDGLIFRAIVRQVPHADFELNLERGKGWLCENPNFSESHCYLNGSNPSVVVVGDSHSTRIYLGLEKIYKARHVDVANIGGVGCPPLLGVVSNNVPGQDSLHCIKNMTAPLKAILMDKNIKHVIFASRGPLYTTGKGFGNIDGDKYGSWSLSFEDVYSSNKSNSDVFEKGLSDTLTAFRLAGKKVTFIYDVPELGFDVRSCVNNRPFSFGAKDKLAVRNLCAVNREDYLARNHDFRILVDHVLDGFPDVARVDLAEVLCDNKYCYGGKNGVLYYTDDDHLSRRGAEFVAYKLLDKFN